MGKKSPKTAPFLIKLQSICSTISSDIGNWNEAGDQFNVREVNGFFTYLKGYFEGSSKTFFRQLSYFRFVKREVLPCGFSFSHSNFRRGDIVSLALIKRVNTPACSSDTGSQSEEGETPHGPPGKSAVNFEPALRYSKLEQNVVAMQAQVSELTRVVLSIVGEFKRQLASDDMVGPSSRKRHHFDLDDDQMVFGFDEQDESMSAGAFTHPFHMLNHNHLVPPPPPSYPPARMDAAVLAHSPFAIESIPVLNLGMNHAPNRAVTTLPWWETSAKTSMHEEQALLALQANIEKTHRLDASPQTHATT